MLPDPFLAHHCRCKAQTRPDDAKRADLYWTHHSLKIRKLTGKIGWEGELIVVTPSSSDRLGLHRMGEAGSDATLLFYLFDGAIGMGGFW